MTENTQNGTVKHEDFERRCLQLAREFGKEAETFEELPPEFQGFFKCIGFARVCSYLVICDLNKGLSMRRVAMRYSLTERQVFRIKENSRASSGKK